MESLNSADARAFRDEVRTFLAEKLPPELRRGARRGTSVFLHPDIADAWQRILHAKGWAAPDWPVEYGGTGWNEIQRYIWAEEYARAHAPGLSPMGLKMVAPVIMHYGSPKQKATLLPRILSGEDRWCQGYSEPGSGSDLASLKLRAVRDGNDYVLNGSKIWTTHAHFANRMFCLVRTSSEGRPQTGITFLLLEMDTPGITVSPIHTLAGEHEFNQVFFDDVRVPVSGRLGAENDGWTVAKHLLTFERGGRYAPGLAATLEMVREAAEATGWLAHESNRERLAREAIAVEALRAIELASLEGRGPSDAVRPSMMKVLGTEASQRIDLLALEIAAEWQGSLDDAPDAIAVAMPKYLNNRAASIYAGSNEIQRDLIARVVVDQAA
ncbi:acyl-CoA dehydrogenase family protein [Sphingomonas dokdonensis]|uniref:Acyl-CoA dehydrogenase n=1 Tax=Sphingomonas dokdonensis TaxID=344880 RepID=A0A245ZUM9_9SPHN|nr:acyl-CoA dehydrogenase family protein [Sphingomonas dokdonensis]OWK33444.1 acyl-CoA dehydrogenase [Sphingomonas dokdonensis]